MTRHARGSDLAYLGAVALGATLAVVTALNQPYSYDELTQIQPYGSGTAEEITTATRQPPLAPLLEAGIQHLLGEGQLQQRLLPVLCGVGSLVVLALLLRRYGLRYAGAAALAVTATMPLMVRYSAYTRPYSEPLFVMLLCALAVQAWLDTGRLRWLLTGGAAAFVLPLVRLPEPVVFLVTTVVVLLWLALRGNAPWQRSAPMAVLLLSALGTVGVRQFLDLRQESENFTDTTAGGILDRFGAGLHELLHHALPLVLNHLAWWPLTVLLGVAVLVLPACRRRLFSWPAWLPLLAAPVAFLVAYHLVFRISFEALPYRERFMTFFVPAFTLVVAALLAPLEDGPRPRWRTLATVALVVAVVATWLPDTWRVLTRDAAPDFAAMSRVLHEKVPSDAIVLYDRTTPAGASRQRYPGEERYLHNTPFLMNVKHVARHHDDLPTTGPVYLLFNGQCAYHGRCIPGLHHAVDYDIRGWHIVYRHDRFTLYAPDSRLESGPPGAAEALAAAGQAMPVELGYLHTYAAVAVLRTEGRTAEAAALLASLDDRLTPALRSRIESTDRLYHFLPG